MELEEITDAELTSLSEAIYKRYGVDFVCYENKSLKRRVLRIIHIYKLNSVAELWMKLLREKDFILTFINEITVGLTSMFRDPELWIHMKKVVLPQLANQKEINIWHAGCSSGEEIYSMGIVLKEAGLFNKAKALATDINTDAIKEAQEGVYHKIKMIENSGKYKAYNPQGTIDQYYDVVDHSHVKMKSELRQHVTFQTHNLVSQQAPLGMKFDIIFCRNVMIYFDQTTKAKLISQFYKSLNPGGHFIIGYFDSIASLVDKNMYSLGHSDLRVYTKIVQPVPSSV